MPAAKKIELLLDSGAYSCWKRRENLDLDAYVEFVRHYQDWIAAPVNLDVIPAEYGRVPTAAEVEQSAEDGFVNSLYMRNRGVEPMPVFHQGEQLKWLEAMVDEGFEWIGISPANDRTTAQKIVWLDTVFAYLGGHSGFPKVKTHGFGVTAMEIMFRYPWYSVDSTTWLMIASYGGIIVPQRTIRGPDFTQPPLLVQLADRRDGKPAPKSIMKSSGHFDHLGGEAKEWIREYLATYDLDLDAMRVHFKYRCQACALFYREMMKVHELPSFTCDQIATQGFFSQVDLSSRVLEGSPSPLSPSIRMFFTVPTSYQHSWALETMSCNDRLISYYYFKDRRIQSVGIDHYVVHGTFKRNKDEDVAVDRSLEVC